MRSVLRFLLSLFIVSSLLFIVQKTAFAEGEFETDYEVHYQINTNGLTTVTQEITLENKTPNYYADKFELKIGSTKVADVRARDQTGDLETEVKFENNVTTIGVKFKQRVIGAGKTLPWTLSYTSSELATKAGQIWEVSIPRLAKSADSGSYDATVSVPRSFGPKAFAIPEPEKESQTSQGQEYNFNKDQLLKSGISISFGEKQVFSFKLNYFLENPNVTAQVLELALPPDNNFQKIVLEKIEPKPLDVDVDADGNFLAKYRLGPKQNVSVMVEGQVEVFSKPFRKIIKNLTDTEKEIYTQPQQYWETDNAFIKEKAQELKTPQKIYEYVSNFLIYSTERVNEPTIERKGAAAAVAAPKEAVCMEFTDLFIAIARAAGIPAREVEGYAFTQNERLRPLSLNLYEGDVLHAWPEYWDNENGWVQIDPTWGSTSGGLDYFNKLDFNHITFVQRGISSVEPYPAGAYTEEGKENEKTVFVSFSKDLPAPLNTNQITIDAPKNAYALLPLKIKANLINTGQTSFIGEELTLTHGSLKNKSQNPILIPILPPFSNKQYIFNLETDNVVSSLNESLVLTYRDSQISHTVLVQPFYKVALEPTFLFSIFGSIFIIATGLYLYRRLHKKPPMPTL